MRETHARILRPIGVACLAAVVVGPFVWIADLLGLRFSWLSVRTAFLLMLGGLVVADVVAYTHLIFFSRLTRREKWRWVHVLMLPFQMFAAFEYLIGSARRS
jgi:hypothetical protein